MDGGAAVPGRMMSQAVGAAALPVVGGGGSASSGPQGSSAFTYGGMWRGGQIFFKIICTLFFSRSFPTLSLHCIVSAGLSNSQEQQQQRMTNQHQLSVQVC